jgi:hypothetical protein
MAEPLTEARLDELERSVETVKARNDSGLWAPEFVWLSGSEVLALVAEVRRAEAAARLVARLGEGGDAPWWWDASAGDCLGCGYSSLDWRIVRHYDGCAALELSAALATAGGEGTG